MLLYILNKNKYMLINWFFEFVGVRFHPDPHNIYKYNGRGWNLAPTVLKNINSGQKVKIMLYYVGI